MEDWEHVETFMDLVNKGHADPFSAFEYLRFSKAEGKELVVAVEVRQIMVDAGIIAAATAIDFDHPDDTNAAMLQAVTRYYSQGSRAEPRSRDDTFGTIPSPAAG